MFEKRHNYLIIASLVFVFAVVVVIGFMISNFTPTFAYENSIPIPQTRKGIYIYDQGSTIDDDVEDSLNSILAELNKKTDVNVAVLSVSSLNGKSFQDYSDYVFNHIDLDKENLILLLFSQSDYGLNINRSEKLEAILDGSKCNSIIDNFCSKCYNNKDYSNATISSVKLVTELIAKEYDVTIKSMDDDLNILTYNNRQTYNIWSAILDGIMSLLYGIIAVITILVLYYAIKSITTHDDDQ